MRIRLQQDLIRIGRRFAVSFQRTLRVPDDGRDYPLPAGLGRFPVLRTAAVASNRRPAQWRTRDAFFIPLYRREALWLAFQGQEWHPVAVQVFVDGVNALTGGRADEPPQSRPQNYLVTPHQPWLDGVVARSGKVRQFVAAPLGGGQTIGAQVGGGKSAGGFMLRIFDAVPGRFPDRPPPENAAPRARGRVQRTLKPIGLGIGGAIRQKVYPDPYGVDAWDAGTATEVQVFICGSEQYQAVTGRSPPPTPITAYAYAAAGLPWLEIDDHSDAALEGSEVMRNLRSVSDVQTRKQASYQGPKKISGSREKRRR